MAWQKLIGCLALSFGLCATASMAQEQPPTQDHDPDYYKVPSYKIGKITSITVTTPSKRVDYDPKERCDTFVMNQKLSTFFFTHSRLVSGESNFHDSDYSSCEAEGKIQFANGDAGDWTISRYGSGLLQMTEGKLKGKLLYLHCRKCEDWGL
jgi:hypothetical protein